MKWFRWNNKRLFLGALAGFVAVFYAGYGGILPLSGPASEENKPVAAFPESARFAFEYRVTVKPASSSSRQASARQTDAGKELLLWAPYPVENTFQTIEDFQVDSPWPWSLQSESEHGNKMIFIRAKMPEEPVTLRFRYRVQRKVSGPHSGSDSTPKKGTGIPANADGPQPDKYLQPNRMIPANATISRMAKTATKGISGQEEKLEAIYHYVVEIMRYDKSGTGWGRGDAVWACDAKRGNCTDFHSLFIGMARSQDIPSQFEIGFSIPPDLDSGSVSGYHCWAKGFHPGRGWIPLDATEAKKTGLVEEYFGRIPPNRIHFSSGRDIRLQPPQKGEPLNYFIYPYAETGGREYTDLESAFRFKKL